MIHRKLQMSSKKSLLAVFAAIAALICASCDGKDSPIYDSAETPAEAQRVYFAEPSLTQIVSADATSFDVNVYRPENKDADELTVQLLFTDESGLFSIPQSVTFPAGVSYATIPVTYSVASMTPNQVYPTAIAIDDANANEYGIYGAQNEEYIVG